MTDTHRKKNPEPLIIPTIIQTMGSARSASTREVAEGDAQRVLEALVAEYGVEATVAALDK
jgi:hypothetical protein